MTGTAKQGQKSAMSTTRENLLRLAPAGRRPTRRITRAVADQTASLSGEMIPATQGLRPRQHIRGGGVLVAADLCLEEGVVTLR